MTDIETLDDGRYTAVVDAIEDGYATVFFEQNGEEIASTVLDSQILPDDARHADAILSVMMIDGELTEMEYDPERTEKRAERAQNRFDRLSERPPSDEEQ